MRVTAFAALFLTLACSDPVRDKAIDSLGGEVPGIPEGPRHRAGQPCLVCHGGDGPGDAVFSFGGTVYQKEDTEVPLESAVVRILDARGRRHEVATNCVGNFFVVKGDFEPTYPVWVKIIYGHFGPTPFEHAMGTPIYREGSCGKCHKNTPGAESAGRVYLIPAQGGPPVQLPVPGCQ